QGQGGLEFYRDRGLTFESLFTIADIQAHFAQIK
ncbi:MAG: orotate phosphoribosyltransferase, partial [Leptolyngbya sp. RL_3_1]|nr:orotate phosphoribosyltransferase [Leptolyngbya sp. RL_3_1]